MNIPDGFRAAMLKAGLAYGGPVHADGKLHRFKVEGDKGRPSWYVLHGGRPTAGAFGCWKRGLNQTWCDRSEPLSPFQLAAVREKWSQADRERERIDAERRKKARRIAAWIMERSKPVTDHQYLATKRVRAFGDVRESRGNLVLPLRDADGELHSLQFIGADGTKRFLRNGAAAGCSFTVSDKPDGPLVVCEGYATGASIHEATGFAVVAAMNCGNLKSVSEALRAKWPEREITIAADNDQFTPGNPGLAKANEAAKTIHAKLAVPQFNDQTTKPTDFNDLHNLEGINIVKDQISTAAAPAETDEERLQRLAKLPPIEYDREREKEAKRAGVRVSTLDDEVNNRRPKAEEAGGSLQGRGLNLPDVEPWAEPVSGPEVLAEVSETLARYVVLPDGAADAVALWILHTHCFALFGCSPRLNITSPEKGCGKTTLRDLLTLLVPRPLSTENLSVAVLFRVVEDRKPTILADECDAWLRDNEELRGLLNSGHRRGGQALRCVGDEHEVRAFNVFAPAVLCGIGSLPGTLHDRSIVIRLERAKPGELRERFDSRRTEPEQKLCRMLARWCVDNEPGLAECDPTLPTGCFNRTADNWRPLFAIAELAVGEWPKRAAEAFAKLAGKDDPDAHGVGAMLLADIQRAFLEASDKRMFSKTLVGALCAMTDRPWPEANKGRPITEVWLARRLRSFDIQPDTLRIGDERLKGYTLDAFQDKFDRYLPSQGESSRDIVTTADFIEPNATSQPVTPPEPVTDEKPHETPANNDLSRCHASIPPVGVEMEEDKVYV